MYAWLTYAGKDKSDKILTVAIGMKNDAAINGNKQSFTMVDNQN